MIRAVTLVLALAAAMQAQDWVPTYGAIITSYLQLARMAQITGDVVIHCTLNGDGTVADAEVVSGPALLKEQARRNALEWKFRRTPSGEGSSVNVTYQYRLEGSPQDRPDASFSILPLNIVRVVAHPVVVKTIAD